jgi:hypothetical protein
MTTNHGGPHEWSLSDGQCVHCGDYNPGVWMRDRDQHTGRPKDDDQAA